MYDSNADTSSKCKLDVEYAGIFLHFKL